MEEDGNMRREYPIALIDEPGQCRPLNMHLPLRRDAHVVRINGFIV